MTLLRGAGFSSVMLCAGTAVGVAVQWLLARTLGVQEYSYYTYASAWLGVLALVSRLGYDQSLVRFLPAYRVKGEWQHFRDMLRDSDRRAWLASLLFAMTLINLVMNQADVMLLGILGDVRQAGLYATAARLASLAGFGLLAVNMILAPMITELHATGQRHALQRMLTRGARVALLAMLLCGVFMAVAGPTLLGWFGPEFREAYRPLLILLAGHAANTLGGSVGFLMTMTGHERRALAVIGGAAALNLVLHVALIPQFGMLGAAAATAVATLVWNVLLVADAWRHLRLDPTSLGRFVASPPQPCDANPLLAIPGASPCPDQTF